MKRRLMLAAMSLILTVTLSVTSMNTVAEASPKMSPTEENLEITINSFLESDGAVAEELTDEMLKTFLETPLDFLRVIDTYPLDKQELLLSRIANVAVGMPDEERLSFEDIIYSADETTPGISLLETYYSEALEATPPQNSVSNLPKYDMESVNQIVKAYLASDSEGNEAFYNYLSNVYSAEPELMESVMMNYTLNMIIRPKMITSSQAALREPNAPSSKSVTSIASGISKSSMILAVRLSPTSQICGLAISRKANTKVLVNNNLGSSPSKPRPTAILLRA